MYAFDTPAIHTPSLPDTTVRLRPYTIVWPLLFRKEWVQLRVRLGSGVLAVQHVGSTAIPGMLAKPIIDVNVAVADLTAASPYVGLIERCGYTYCGENEEPHEYCFVKGDPVAYRLYVMELGSEAWTARCCFRDYVMQRPELIREYTSLKRQLVQRFPDDVRAYQAGKGEFIQKVLHMALERDPGDR